MRRFRRTVVSLLVWLTAAATVVAATPRFVCRCQKCCCYDRFCTSQGEQRQCCKGRDSEPVAGCCCGRAPETSSADPNSKQVSGPGCTKALVQQHWLSI